MKTLIIYDSKFGNTEKIAKEIGQVLSEQDKVEIKYVGKVCTTDLNNVGFLIVGTPTHGFSPSEKTGKFLNSLKGGSLGGVKVAAFDTRTSKKEINSKWFLKILVNFFGYAAKPLSKKFVNKGGELVEPYAGFEVKGKEGPLLEGELERARNWIKEVRAKV